jgi:hypothetical protein
MIGFIIGATILGSLGLALLAMKDNLRGGNGAG